MQNYIQGQNKMISTLIIWVMELVNDTVINNILKRDNNYCSEINH